MRRAVQIAEEPAWVRHRATIRAAIESATSSDEAEIVRHRELVLAAIAEIDAAKDAIEAQLAEARRNTAATRDYSDGEWYQSCERASRAHSRLRQEAQAALGKLKLRLKALHTAQDAAGADGVDIARVRELWRALGRALGELP